jgi:colanic acid biosynthesis glycosyl transferase WcaI
MRILLYGSNFSPELTGVGKYTGEMARWLAGSGHDVRVVTAPPHYPEWVVKPGFSAWRWSRQIEDGVVVWRCPTWVPHRPSGVTRLLHLASFAVSSLPIMLSQWIWKPNIVWVVEPPLMCAPTAAVLARLSGARSWLHIQDFEVDAAFELGLLEGKGIRSFALGIERWLMRRFDVVSTISGKMIEKLKAKGVSPERIVSFPNWVEIGGFRTVDSGDVAALRARLKIPEHATVALYSGNMGRKQGLEILAEVAKRPEFGGVAGEGVCFVFCGNGVGREDLEQECAALANVRFLDLQPVAGLPVLLKLADIHLLPQRGDASDLVMPSKLTGIMASGRPVVATAGHDTELARVASVGGLVVPPDNPAAMAAAVARLASDKTLRVRLGAAAIEYAIANLDSNKVLGELERAFAKLVEIGKRTGSSSR